MKQIVSKLPATWQARYWAWWHRKGSKINAIRDLRDTAKIPLKDAKEAIDPFFVPMKLSSERCPTCGKCPSPRSTHGAPRADHRADKEAPGTGGTEMTEADTLVTSMSTICDSASAHNTVAWHNLHKAGITVDVLRKTVASGGWMGPEPCFDQAPAPDDPMWLYLEGKEITDESP